MTDVVLLHAYPLNRAMWDAQAEFLTRIGRRVLVPDYAGFGNSSLPPDETIGSMAEQVLKQIAEPVVFVGCSMGGYVLMEIIRQRPDLVAGAIFVDTKPTADTDEARANRLALADSLATAQNTEALADQMIPLLLGQTTRTNKPEVVQTVRDWILAADPKAAAAAQRAMAARPDSRPTLSSYEGPALVVWGSEDTMSPTSEQKQFFEVMPQAVGREIEGCGHLPSVEEPQALNDILLDVIGDWVG